MDFFTRSRFFLAFLIIFGFVDVSAHYDGPVITAVIWGGEHSTGQETCQFEQYERKEKRKSDRKDLRGEYNGLSKLVDSGVDVIELPAVQFEKAISEGLIDKQGVAVLKLDETKFIPGALRAEGVAAMAHSAVISYRKDVFKEANEYPKSIKDLWDTERFPGKRGLVYGARNNLEWALMADGVAKNDVYKVLATAKGVKRALAKLNELKPHIIWFGSEHEVMEALQRHHVGTTDANPDAPAVVFGAISSDLAYMETRNLERHDHKGFMLDVIWDGQMIEFIYWAKPNNPKDSEAANKFIEVAASEETCIAAINRSALGVTRSDLMENRKIQQYVLQKMPTFKQNLDKGVIVDGKFWAINMDNLMVKFKKWFKNSGCSRAKVAY